MVEAELIEETPAKDSKDIEVLFVKSKIKEYIKANECQTASEVVDSSALNDIFKKILDKAIERAKANGRKTVQARDL